uniref:RAS p21 protein activator 2 n=1 Tax=Scleropages formosus TaxID=113540 RepID=A0A8C9U822_SCLFO
MTEQQEVFNCLAGDAKNLASCSGSTRLRDACTFCTISLDQEEVYRTKVLEKSLSPFYGEDFYFEIPRPFQYLSFYVYAKTVFQRDLPIGKVSIRKEDLSQYSGKEHWHSLQPVDANSEVQGKVHLEMRLNEVITENGSMCQQLLVQIIECQGLPLVNGQSCDPYATVSLVGPARQVRVSECVSHWQVTRSSSYTKKSQFQVEDEDIEKLEIKVDLWNNGNLAQDVFLGETRVPVKILRNDTCHRAWYLLQPKGNGKTSKVDELGSLRLKVTYTEDNVLPSDYYTPLRTLLLKSPEVKPISASAAHILGDICRERYVLPMVRLLLHHNCLVPFVSAVAAMELDHTQEANTIFRGNSLATRCIDDMMKIVGRSYLTITLKPVLDEICESNKSCEIDPMKLKEGDNVEANKENLQLYVQKVFSSITQSSASCPPVMCDVFRSLRQMASRRFPGQSTFLTFTPGLLESPLPHPPPHFTKQLRNYVYNEFSLFLCPPPSSSQSSFKESFMYDFFKSFQEDKYVEEVKKFLNEISSNVSKESSGIEDSVVLKEGEVQKRAQGRKRIGKKNFNKRWLCVTNRQLSYHKQRGKEPLNVIPVEHILGVEKLDESAFNRKNMFQVILPEKPLYIQASNCVEAREWVEVISQVSRCNEGRRSHFHPSAYLSSAWLCCKATCEDQPGCKPCTMLTLANLQLDIDCDRETERIFSLFSANISKLQKMEDACASIAVYQGPQKEQEEYSLFTIQDPKETFQTIQQIRIVLEDLQNQHEAFKSVLTAKYGSQRHGPFVYQASTPFCIFFFFFWDLHL